MNAEPELTVKALTFENIVGAAKFAADTVNEMIDEGEEPADVRKNLLLDEEDVRVMRRLHRAGYSLRKLAGLFNVHYTVVGAIMRGELWKHVTDEAPPIRHRGGRTSPDTDTYPLHSSV